jgi:putative sterol carrier protein
MADLTPKSIFEERIPSRLRNNPDRTKGINAIYQFKITGENGGDWVVDLTQSPGEVRAGSDANAKCTITVGDQDFVDIVTGKLNGQMAFMAGKLKVSGDMSLALKLGAVLG